MEQFSKFNIAIADQVVVSGINFLTGILIARFLGPEEFGRYTFVWIIVLFFANLQYALVIAPMMSIGPKQRKTDHLRYYGGIVVFESIFILLFLLLIIMGVWGFQYWSPEWRIQGFIFPLAFSGSAYLIQDFLRRYLFTRERETTAFFMDVVSSVLQAVGLVLLLSWAGASIRHVLFVMGLASIFSIIFGVKSGLPSSLTLKALKMVVARHKAFVFGTVFFTLVQWTGPQIILFLSGIKLGPDSLGGIRAVINLLAPLNIILLGLNNILPRNASRTLNEGGKTGVLFYLRNISFFIGGILAVSSTILFIFRKEIIGFIYSKEFVDYAQLVGWQVLYIFFDFLILILITYIKTIEKTRLLTYGTFIGLLASVMVVWFLIPVLGERATFIGMIINQSLVAVWLGISIKISQTRAFS